MTLDLPGFADPVLDAQTCFRALLAAMSRPGRIQSVAVPAATPPPLGRAAAAALLTLVDGETRLAVDPALTGAGDWITFHCGARAGPAAEADFVLAAALPALGGLRAGIDEAPEASATVILEVEDLGAGTPYLLSGPGLRAPETLLVAGLPADFAARWAANHALYPCGVDLILCAGARFAALPRSLRIVEG
jgi:alpha-D-ribose 1-methylphosphonate 5-triphosphate synthase subunit PhnH